MESLEIQTGAPTVHWEYRTNCICVVEAKIITPGVKKLTLMSFFY